jgi:plastocyanin domain-containing protein
MMLKFIKTNIFLVSAFLVAVLLIVGAIYFSGRNSSSTSIVEEEALINNVSVIDGKQIILLRAKGGFSPEHSVAKAGLPTILRINTLGTFDCSSVVRLPSLNITQNLPLSGTTDIDLGTQKVAVLSGTCGMGMYPFDIEFN